MSSGGGKVISFLDAKMGSMKQGALVSCPCGQTHVMRLDQTRTCACGRFYGYVEDEKAMDFLRAIGVAGDGKLQAREFPIAEAMHGFADGFGGSDFDDFQDPEE